MKIIIIDTGLGGKDFITKLRKEYRNIECEFVKPFADIIGNETKAFIRDTIMALLYTYSYKNIHSIIIACHSISSCILDILIHNKFIINGIRIYEPIIPMCLYIKQKKYKNILILATPLTYRIRWHYRILKTKRNQINNLPFPLLAKELETHTSYSKSLDKLKKQKDFIEICDCVVLGCTHYNIIKNEITDELRYNYNFKGVVLDSNQILLKYYDEYS